MLYYFLDWKRPLSCYKGCNSSFNDHWTRRQHEERHNHGPGHRCTCGKIFENISSVLCFCGAGEKWASNIADYHVWPVEYHDVGPYCWWIWTESHHMICDIVWCYLQPELVLLVFHLSGNVYTFPPARSIWWLQFTDRPWQEQLLQSNSPNSSRFTSFSIYGLR